MKHGKFENYAEWSEALIKIHGYIFKYDLLNRNHRIYTKDYKHFVVFSWFMTDEQRLKQLFILGFISQIKRNGGRDG